MNFMYLFRGGREAPEEEMPARMKKWEAWINGLGDSYKDGAPLGEDGEVVEGKGRTEDGVVGDEDSEVGGYQIVSADDLDKAVELAGGCPIFDVDGVVEVRPILEM